MSYSTPLAAVGLLLALASAAPASAQSSMSARPAAPAAASAQAQAANPQMMFDRWDTNKNKALSFDEFDAGWKEVQMSMVMRKLHATFVSMDANKSGGLEANEYANLELVKRAGKGAPMLSFFDTDKNGKLDFREYSQMIGKMMTK